MWSIKLQSITKIVIHSAGAALAVMWCCANPLETYRDVKRVLVIYSPSALESAKINALLTNHRAALAERDIAIVDVSRAEHRLPQSHFLTNEQTEQLRKQLKIASAETKPVFILIGKDGGEKAREYEALPIQSLFQVIDQMPIRRREIEQQQKKAR